MEQFTILEKQVLDSLIALLYAEPGFSDVDANDIAKETKLSTKIIRGVLSSLVKKGVIHLDETDTYNAPKTYVLIYLKESYWHLHPEWSKG